jgi:hypothetical protein
MINPVGSLMINYPFRFLPKSDVTPRSGSRWRVVRLRSFSQSTSTLLYGIAGDRGNGGTTTYR